VLNHWTSFFKPSPRAGALGLAVALALTACPITPPNPPPSNPPPTPPTPSAFSLEPITTPVQITQGSSAELEIQIRRDGLTDPVTVAVNDLPAGVTVGALTITGTSGKLRFLAATDAAQGGPISTTVIATAGGETKEAKFELSVRGTPGSLDTTFNGGRVTLSLGGSVGIVGAAFTPDGKIVVVLSLNSGKNFGLTRFTADGKLDPTFSDGRGKIVDLAPGRDFIGGIVVQPDGKILIAAALESAQVGSFSVGVARFTPDGVLDRSFDRDGISTLEVGAGPSINALALALDGKIVIAGSVFNGQDRDFLLARFNPDGQAGFDGSAFRTDSFGMSNDNASAVTIAPDGGIILAGEAVSNNLTSQFVLARYRGTDGFKDPTFGQAGHATVFFNDEIRRASAQTLTVQPDGKIVSAGFAADAASTNMAVARLSLEGKPDLGFAGQGALILGFDPVQVIASDAALEPNGRIVLAGTASSATNNDFALARLLPDGKLDLGFGNGGRQITDFGGTDDRVTTILRASDGRIVLVGSSGNNVALARYWP
jgi:uncharacterized delta-60 repeat protein